MKLDDLIIKVPEPEYPGLLQRDRVLSDVQKLALWISLMKDLVNYGTNLVPRCLTSSSRSLKDIVLICILLRQAISMLDGAEVLLSSGAVHAAKLQMRALLEAALYIDWILQSDTERKADYYWVHNLRRMRHWAERVGGKSKAGQDFVEMMKKMGVEPAPSAVKRANQHLSDVQKALSKSEFARIDAHFERGKKARHGSWYSPLGPHNLRELASKVGKLPHYSLWYSLASDVMHGSNYSDHLTFAPGRVTVEPVRYLKDFEQVYHFSVITIFDVYRSILTAYRPGELPAFSRKYREKWQTTFMNIPKVTINTELVTI